MITEFTTSGDIVIRELDNNGYRINLYNWEGELELQGIVNGIQFNINGNCKLNSDIILFREKLGLDFISIQGDGTCEFKNIRATSININSDIKAEHLYSNVTKIVGCKVESTHTDENFMYSVGHIWIVDCTLISNNCEVGIKCPYILIDNADIDINSVNKCIDGNEILSIENCDNVEQTDTLFKSSAIVRDENDNPLIFIHNKEKDIDRRKVFSHLPAHTNITNHDLYRRHLGYTNPDIHRFINQDGDFEYPDIRSKKYEITIPSLESIRGIDREFHDEDSEYVEIP